MTATQTTGLSIVIMIAVVIVVRLVVYNVLSARLEHYLDTGEYDKLEKALDNFFCKVTYAPFRREMLRLNGYSMQGDEKKVAEQFRFMFENMRLSPQEEISLAQRGFYYYMEHKQFERAQKMLEKLQGMEGAKHVTRMMEITYDILAKKKSCHLDVLVKAYETMPEGAPQENIGVLEYLIGLSYSYKKDTASALRYLEQAQEHCQGSDYEQEVTTALRKLQSE